MPLIDPSSYKAPFLLGNAHIQTILPSYLRHETDVKYDREPFATPDDDTIQLDWSRVGSDKLLVINHGLCGHTHRRAECEFTHPDGRVARCLNSGNDYWHSTGVVSSDVIEI